MSNPNPGARAYDGETQRLFEQNNDRLVEELGDKVCFIGISPLSNVLGLMRASIHVFHLCIPELSTLRLYPLLFAFFHV